MAQAKQSLPPYWARCRPVSLLALVRALESLRAAILLRFLASFSPLSTGLKNDFEGHDNWWLGNVIAFPSGPLLHNGYGGKVGDPGKGYLDGHEDGFVGNTAIVGYEGSYAKPICPGSPGTTVMNSSRVFSPKGQLTTDCGASFDVGAQYAAYTATMADDFIGYARAPGCA